MSDQKKLILVIVLSLGILFGFQHFYEKPRQEAARKAAAEANLHIEPPAAPGDAPNIVTNNAPQAEEVPQNHDDALSASPRIAIETKRLKGSINLKGGRIDDVMLKDYRITVEKDSPQIQVLSPEGTKEPYYADFGWVSSNKNITLPNAESVWVPSRDILTENTPVTLRWDNGQGIIFEREIAVDDNFMFTVKERVINNTYENVSLYPYSLVNKTDTPELLGFAVLHEGLIGVFDENLEEIDFSDIQKKSKMTFESKGGWLGITDKYMLVSIAPEASKKVTSDFVHNKKNGHDRYQFDFRGDLHVAPSGGMIESKTHLFVGAKESKLLKKYREELNIDRFDLAIDYGWLYFLTKPIFLFLSMMYDVIGNFGLCILLLTICVRIILFPLANNSFKAMSKMRLLTPELTRLKEVYGDDKMRYQQEIMALYKREKVNPMAGCLPILIQAPVFFALYKVLFISIEMRHAPFIGWINDLSAPDPTSIFNLFGLLPFDAPFHLGAWPLIMGLTMWIQQKLSPAPADPVQAKMMLLMPIIFTFLLASFPAGLVIYWSWSNILSILQQWYISRHTRLEKKR